MQALVLENLHTPLAFRTLPDPAPVKGSVVVALQASALNHRDVFITEGQYAGIQTPSILGSDGAGEWRGKKVVLYPALEWGHDQRFQGKNFRVLGMPDAGTFATQIAIPRTNVMEAPPHLSMTQAAALPLAGLTAWRTVFTRCGLKKGEKILITGIGGGVALIAMQLAIAAGATVFVTSGDDEKLSKAMAAGAVHGENYRKEGWDKRLKTASGGGFDVIIDAAAGDGFASLPGLCLPGARIGFYGGTLGKVNGLSLQPVFWKQISLFGSTMGSPKEFKQMLAFVTKHEIIPVVDAVFDLSEGNEALNRMRSGLQFGKIVLKH